MISMSSGAELESTDFSRSEMTEVTTQVIASTLKKPFHRSETTLRSFSAELESESSSDIDISYAPGSVENINPAGYDEDDISIAHDEPIFKGFIELFSFHLI